MEKENRSDKFKRLAETRMSKVLMNMDLISNLSNKQRYEYTESEIEELFEAYQRKGNEIRQYFSENPPENKPIEINFNFIEKSGKLNKKNIDFRRLSEKRMSRIFKDMNLIANLSTKTNYAYSENEIIELFQVYYEKGVGVKERFFPRSQFKFSRK
ncbi:hypothetical protein [Niallia circulans]|uniref:Uncharacterized protein n=1 Tax=Niallia circulans TaxID=1397 RepID=A0A941GLB1_NIACI|nr:hypothetical protein [Niallia circulans]MCB5239573.1 hypothetical protein [Niallia circulans]